jgi:predicted nucleotidyltransferase
VGWWNPGRIEACVEFVSMALGGSVLGLLVERHRDQIVALVLQHRARTIAVFGSVARGEDTGTSDVDFLVEFEPGSSLLDLIHLEEALAELLGVDVDVVSSGALLERDDAIRRDAIPL